MAVTVQRPVDLEQLASDFDSVYRRLEKVVEKEQHDAYCKCDLCEAAHYSADGSWFLRREVKRRALASTEEE